MTQHTSEPWEPYFDDDEAEGIIGKHLLVGVTHRNHQDEVIGLEQFHGEVIRANREEGIITRLSGSNEERWVPPDLSRLKPAAPGNYRLKDSGEVVVDPDFVSAWTVYPQKSHWSWTDCRPTHHSTVPVAASSASPVNSNVKAPPLRSHLFSRSTSHCIIAWNSQQSPFPASPALTARP